jgi:hypothetical protein
MKYIIESYDQGYLLSGKHEANYSKYNWLIKADINGEILWEKTIGNGANAIVLTEMGQNGEGEIYACGSSRHKDPYGDPIVFKFDSCGEKEWCKVFHSPNHHDFAQCICITQDGGCAISLNMTGETGWTDRICLVRLNSEGELLWRKCYNSQDSLLGNEDDTDLILTPDNGFLITGWCYYTDTAAMLAWLHPYYIKTDSMGNFEWETIVDKESGEVGGQAWTTIISPDNMYYYSSISHYYNDSSDSSPALLKMDMLGNVIGIYDLVSGYKEGKLFTSTFIDDSLIACSAGWGNSDDYFISNALIIDTLGHIINSRILQNDIYLSYTVKTFDKKLLFYTHTYLNNHFDVYLFKFNENLEDDSLYSYPYQYDSLCPYPIASDTIVQDDCDLIVGTQETAISITPETERLFIYPNPASDHVTFQYSPLSMTSLGTVTQQHVITIYDLYGRMVDEVGIPYGDMQVQVNVSTNAQGIYIAVLRNDRGIIGRKKFVVARQ